MTLGDIATKARAITNTDTTSYTDANLLIDLNIWYQKVVSMILESQDESDFDDARNTDYAIVTTPLVASQRDYSIPVSEKVLKVKRIDISYDGVNYYRAEPIDSGTIEYGDGNATLIDQNFSKTQPRYDIKNNAIFIYPLPSAADVAASGVIRAEWTRNVTPFTTSDYTSVLTDSTVVPGYDDPFHPMLAWGAAYEKAVAATLPQLPLIQNTLQDYEVRLRQHYGKKQLDRRLAFTPFYSVGYGR